MPVIRAIRGGAARRRRSRSTPRSRAVAAAALDAGADLLNDVWGVADDPAMVRLAAERGVPIVLMHNRAEARYRDLVAEVVADLQRALDRARRRRRRRGSASSSTRGSGSARRPTTTSRCCGDLAALRVLGRPILLGTSRKSTLGKVLDLPADQRLEATLATTALGDRRPASTSSASTTSGENVRAARVADAVVRGWRPAGWEGPA